jgi:hypothetical protein
MWQLASICTVRYLYLCLVQSIGISLCAIPRALIGLTSTDKNPGLSLGKSRHSLVSTPPFPQSGQSGVTQKQTRLGCIKVANTRQQCHGARTPERNPELQPIRIERKLKRFFRTECILFGVLSSANPNGGTMNFKTSPYRATRPSVATRIMYDRAEFYLRSNRARH